MQPLKRRRRKALVTLFTIGSAMLSTACGSGLPVSIPGIGGGASQSAPSEKVATGPAARVTPIAASSEVSARPTATVPPTLMPTVAPRTLVRTTVPVRRGSIADTLQLSGRVVAVGEEKLAFPNAQVVEAISVKAGDEVAEGQVLLQGNVAKIDQDIEAATARLQMASLRLAETEASVQAAAQQAERKRQESIIVAEQGLKDQRAKLEAAEAVLATLTAGPKPVDVRAAEADVVSATIVLQRAQAAKEQLVRGPDPTVVRTAERAFANAQLGLQQAKADVEKLLRGPDPVALRTAERNLERAKAARRQVEDDASSYKTDGAREAAMLNARLNMETAEEQLAQARKGPDEASLIAARAKVSDSEVMVAAAWEKLEASKKGPDKLAVAAADADIEKARIGLVKAEDALATLKAGPPAAQIVQAERAVEAAQIVVATSEAKLAELSVPQPQSSVSESTLVNLRQAIAQEENQINKLRESRDASILRAPFAGRVLSVQAQLGDQLPAGRAAITVSKPTQPVISATVLDADVERLSNGQHASIQIDGTGTNTLGGTIRNAGPNPNGIGMAAQIDVDWGSSTPPLGATARVSVVLQEHQDALLVPKRALRTDGDRRYVEYLDGDTVRAVDVLTGIVTGNDVEILSGLSDGQKVVLP